MPLSIATWNVNGIRAREAQVLEWIGRDRPDVVCLQELKATREQIPEAIAQLEGYWSYFHGAGAYSGVSLHLRREAFPDEPRFHHPEFDFETRIVVASAGGIELASVYVPNGGKDYEAKLRFLRALGEHAAAHKAGGTPLVFCGDLNVARTDRDVHPKAVQKPDQIGLRADERALIETLLGHGLVDVGRTLDPDNDQLFTWWAPWRNLRQRNIGWRIDYVLASAALAERAITSRVLADVGTSDHAPVLATFDT